MKTGIITFHFASNQGAVLQCYALQKYLENAGNEVRIINYQPSYHTVRYKTKKNPFIYARGFWKKFYYKKTLRRVYLTARSFARCLYMNIKSTDRGVENSFHTFQRRYLKLTREYPSLSDLQKDPPAFDAYISGSDQLWNPEVLDQDFDEAYFLRFGDADITRIAYAVSIGKEMPEIFLRQLKGLADHFDAVSLREYNADVMRMIDKDVHICVDPTFLLEAADYREIEGDMEIQEPYIFVYGFESNDDIFEAIQIAVKKYSCPVVNGSPMRIKYQDADENVRDYGPDLFLTYIKNAACIVTNSFHATAFSIIYEKAFVTVPHSTRGLRMKNLLGRLGLRSCLFGDERFDIDEIIDYREVRAYLNKLRHQSEEFLTMALAGKRGEDIAHYEDEIFTYES